MKHFMLLAGLAIIVLSSSCNQQTKQRIVRDGIIVPDHVVIVMEENHGYDQIVGSDSAPYINKLVTESAVFTDAHGVIHPSQPMTAFPKNFDQLPAVAFAIPDMDNDMHNIGDPGDSAAISRGDNWLKENLSDYVEWAKTHNSLMIYV